MNRPQFGKVSRLALPTLVLYVLSACGSDDPSAAPGSKKAPLAPVDNREQPRDPVAAGGDAGPVLPGVAVQSPCSNSEYLDSSQPLQVPRSCCLSERKYGGRLGADKTCGPNGDESCCAMDQIPGGTFNRMNDSNLPATVPSFNLGRFLITTARFKIFMEEGYALQASHPPTSPAAFSGAHPTLGNVTGWQADWNTGCGGNGCLPQDEDELVARVYKDAASQGWGCTLDHYPQHPRYPVSCIDLYLANAFCAWDGGYLITEAQWEYAVRGGAEQREYAWGSGAPTLDHSVHCEQGGGTWGVDLWCTNPANPVPLDVGHHAAGKGKWGTYDLQGNLLNYLTDDTLLDSNGAPDSSIHPQPCANDCVGRASVNRSMSRGISFLYPNNLEPASKYGNLINRREVTVRKNFNGANFGFRCAYPTSWPAQ